MSHKRRPTTTNTRRLVHENNRSELELEKELSRLEKERAATLKELENETKLFCLNSSSPTKNLDLMTTVTSPRLVSSTSPKPGFRKAFINGRADIRDYIVPLGQSHKLAKSYETLSSPRELASQRTRSISPRSIRRETSVTSSDSSPASSPEAKRRQSNANLQRPASFYDTLGSTSVKSPRAISGSGQIPQIIISTEDVGNITLPRLTSDVTLDSSKESLSLPVKRGRSSSVPLIVPPPVQVNPILSDSGNPSMRPRSSSISFPSESLSKTFARRNSVQSRASEYRGPYRRSSIAVEHFIHDLSRGIDHLGIHHNNNRIPPLSPEEWENLKSCRYLRMPNQS
ncbi:serine/arginine repetitive matrix protein 1 [Biomphalaria glabrata]|nr:serine/arginine repetitive matrix protein 1 [Biomphalaria glabrata]KAI8774122.1 serine/arginine repetitive matrix protein 1 [Biomphalaria glabrata]